MVESNARRSPDEWSPTPAELALIAVLEPEAEALYAVAMERLLNYASYDMEALSTGLRFRDAVDSGGVDNEFDELERHRYNLERVQPGLYDKVIKCAEIAARGKVWIDTARDRKVDHPEASKIRERALESVRKHALEIPGPVSPRHWHAKGFVELSDLAVLPAPFGSLVDDTIDRGSLVLMPGHSGTGKTFLAIDVAMAQASGRSWRGRRTAGGLCLYVAAEDPVGVNSRANAWRVHHGVGDVPFVILPRAINLTTPEGGDILLDAALMAQSEKRQRVRLIVVDTVARCLGGGDENSGIVMGALVRNLNRAQEKTGAALMCIHHMTKGSAIPRGHGSLASASDTIITVATGVATVTRQRASAAGQDFPFRIATVHLGVAGGRAIEAGIIEHLDAPAHPSAAKKPSQGSVDNLAALATAVRDAHAAGRPLKLHRDGGLHSLRATLPAPLSSMGRDALVGLAQAGIDAGVLVSTRGTLSAAATH